MKEYFIKLQNQDGSIKTMRKLLTEKIAKLSFQKIGTTDKNGTTLLEFWEIK